MGQPKLLYIRETPNKKDNMKKKIYRKIKNM